MTLTTNKIEQLKAALDAGLIDQATFDTASTAINAQLSGGGAIAQGTGALAVGAGGVAIGGDNNGTINLGVLIEQGKQPGASQDDLRRAYLARILLQANHLPLFADDSTNAKVRLSSVYTALLTQRAETDAEYAHQASSPERSNRRLSVLDVLNSERKLVLLGGPGSGKSTFVNFAALSMAGELLEDKTLNLATLTAPLPKEDNNDDEDTQPQRWDHKALLPVQILLRDLASQLPPPGTQANAQTVCNYLQTQLEQAGLEEFTSHLKDEMLNNGALILLDGLDEVPEAHERREQIKQAIQDFAATYSRCRFLVTSRTYAYQRQDWKLDNFTEVQLLAFTTGQINRFVKAWYVHMVELLRLTESSARNRSEVLQRTVKRNERIRELAERPLLLTLIVQLQTEGGGTLPEKREELYDKAVEMLLNKWESMKVRDNSDGLREIEPSLTEWLNAGRDNIRKALNRLAFEAHRDQPQLTGTADIRQADLVNALLNASANRSEVKVGKLEEYLCNRAGILSAHGVGMYQFPHRSFQEYLAACHLTDDEFPDKLASLACRDADRWREVVLLAGAKSSRGSSLNAWALGETLCSTVAPDAPATAEYWGALLAGRVLVECANLAQVAPRDEEKLNRIRQWQINILRDNRLPASERALAGRTLATLDDPRDEVTNLADMQFCFMPAGPFVMGDDDSRDKNPQHEVDLSYPCFIGRYPVSVGQWREYLVSSDRSPEEERSLQGRDNDPVTHVSWFDAQGFCDYLTQAWQSQLPKGWIVSLPSEAEWEKAARGGKQLPETEDFVTLSGLASKVTKAGETQRSNPHPQRNYPWGERFDDDKANVQSAIGETSALGAYPSGISPYGCEEMSGNVWEWTRSLWGKGLWKSEFVYPYDPNDLERENLGAGNDVMRVVRGGAWDYHRVSARCACRCGNPPDLRFNYVGFRLVLRSSHVLPLLLLVMLFYFRA